MVPRFQSSWLQLHVKRTEMRVVSIFSSNSGKLQKKSFIFCYRVVKMVCQHGDLLLCLISPVLQPSHKIHHQIDVLYILCLPRLHLHLISVLPARKESRYREPPPTPPGYTALTISDLAEGQHPAPSVPTSTATHTGRRPPDYTTALQRSRMVTQSPDSHQAHQGAKQRSGGLHRTRSPAEEPEAEEEEEGESLSSKLIALRKPKPVAQHTPETPRP